MDGESGATRRRDELINAVERLPTLLTPLQLLLGIQRDLPSVLDVAQKLVAQPPGGGREDHGAVEIPVDRVLQVIAGRGQGMKVAVIGMQLIADRAIVGAQLLQDDARAIGQRLMVGEHAAHGLDGLTCRARRKHVCHHDHRRHGGEAQRQASTNAESRQQSAAVRVLCLMHAT